MTLDFLSSIQIVQWIWLALMVIAIVFEALTPSDLVSIWFAIGAFCALIISIFFPKLILVQSIVFFVVSGVLVASTRKLSRKLQNMPDVKSNIDAIIGKVGKVTLAIKPHEVGEVKLEGKLWSAISEKNIEVDSYVEVLGVDGVKLIVKQLEEETEN